MTVTILDCTAVQRKENDADSIVRFYNCEVRAGPPLCLRLFELARRGSPAASAQAALSRLRSACPQVAWGDAKWRVSRRYNMFHQLHEDLRMEFSTAHCLPPLPPKSMPLEAMQERKQSPPQLDFWGYL